MGARERWARVNERMKMRREVFNIGPLVCRMFIIKNPSHWIMAILFVMFCHQHETRTNHTQAPVRVSQINSTAPNGHTFDDEPHFGREYIKKDATRWHQSRTVAAASAHNDSNILRPEESPLPTEEDPHSTSLKLDHKEARAELASEDLWAIESAQKSDRVSATLPLHNQHHHRSPPYAVEELSSKSTNYTNFRPASLSEPEGHNETLLLKLHRASPIAPIYLRHALPVSLTQPQVVAFQHPASIRKQLGSARGSDNENGYHGGNREATVGGPTSAFVLLPSRPSIYIAQRERQVNVVNDSIVNNNVSSSQTIEAGVQQLDPQVPNIYPSWSGQEESNPTKPSNLSAVVQRENFDLDHNAANTTKGSRQSLVDLENTRSNLTASEVEYEATADDRGQESKSLESNQSTDWSKLLQQAAKSNVMESLMLTNRSMFSLLCDVDSMLVRFKFKQPFHGLVETNSEPGQRCRLFGNGGTYYELRIHLNSCGTRQEMPRLFINNVQVRFQNPFALEAQISRAKEREREQTDSADSSFDVDEVKTIICSYPARPSKPLGPVRSHPDQPSNSDLSGIENQFDGTYRVNLSPTNLSDKIVDSPNPHDQTPTRLVYEPILLISGLLLLAMAFTLALITSAYLLRKRNTKLASRSRSSESGYSQMSWNQRGNAGNVNPTGGHGQSGLQWSHGHGLASPPLIGLSKDHSIRDGRLAGKGLVRPRNGSTANCDNRKGSTTWKQSDLSKRSRKSRDDFVGQIGKSPAREVGHDSLDSEDRGEGTSVTTIEIPYVGQSNAAAATSFSPNPTGYHTQNRRKFGRDEAVQTDMKEPRESSYFSKIEQIKTHEELIERTYASEAPQRSKPMNRNQTRESPKKQSPLPFGSFRSKLTSPAEFKRLQEVLRLFEEDQVQHDRSSALARLRMKIQRTLSELERRRLIDMLSNDEVFRSNILDSTDQESFHRKLQNNPNYSDKFSSVTWKLLEEILLKVKLEELFAQTEVPHASSNKLKGDLKRKHETAARAMRAGESDLGPAPRESAQSASKREKLNKMGDNSAETLVREQKDHMKRQGESSLRDDSMGPIRVSHSNSTSAKRVPFGASINVDSVIDISAPKTFTAFTRSSFKHVSKFEEFRQMTDDSLPYMDGSSQSSIERNSLSSVEMQQRKKTAK